MCAAGHRARRIQLLAVEHPNRLRDKHHILAGWHGLGLGVDRATNNNAFR